MKKKLAAIDIGTNSFHLVIAEADDQSGKFTVIGRERDSVRLGTGSTDLKYLSEDVILKGIETLRRFKGLADSAGAPVRAIATSAVREAHNQAEFIKRVKQETGIKIEIASGVEEARYIYLGVLQALPLFNEHILLIDIGGGSTEFLVGMRREVHYDNSMKLGAVRFTNRFFNDNKSDKQSIKECRKFIKGIIQPVIRDISLYRWEKVVGSSGTILGAAGIINVSRGGSPEDKLNNFIFTAEELYETADMITSQKSVKEIKKIPGLDPTRADIFTAGILILERIFKELKIKEMICSEYAMREGIVYDTMEKMFSLNDGYHLEDIRMKSVMHIAENFHYEKTHSLHVTSLALKLFDELKALHKLNRNEREYLHVAGILHEVGCFVSHSQHHRHSYYLIRNSEMLGFTENEKALIANIARYHRKSHPKLKHPEFEKLLEEDRQIVRKLAGILRIADGLDRTHLSAVKDINCNFSDHTVSCQLVPTDPSSQLELEIWAADMKKTLFEETFGMQINFIVN